MLSPLLRHMLYVRKHHGQRRLAILHGGCRTDAFLRCFERLAFPSSGLRLLWPRRISGATGSGSVEKLALIPFFFSLAERTFANTSPLGGRADPVAGVHHAPKSAAEKRGEPTRVCIFEKEKEGTN